MSNFKRISVADARVMLDGMSDEQGNAAVRVVDVRDEQSFVLGHIEAATHVHAANLQEFIAEADQEQPLIVYCYHGHMSQAAAAYFAEQGFADAYSLDGGYAAWVTLKNS